MIWKYVTKTHAGTDCTQDLGLSQSNKELDTRWTSAVWSCCRINLPFTAVTCISSEITDTQSSDVNSEYTRESTLASKRDKENPKLQPHYLLVDSTSTSSTRHTHTQRSCSPALILSCCGCILPLLSPRLRSGGLQTPIEADSIPSRGWDHGLFTPT